MYSIAFHLVAEEMDEDVEQNRTQRMERRQLRDATNPLELSQALFEKYYRVNKAAFRRWLSDGNRKRIRRFSCSM
ncbi:PREDICTED: uncharacterized protein LOC108365098 isoform X2 [Rhagoletis zephyria]|uniref:uncharacterized protein LOC108365098 isoform X2 n=1 Tax=Rhagoletis zephyria TaxID=28612 RepID=UPI000811443E|nr:PREDICTED: uncharacterized protein LOC108365098 isoform X2 [Rhagoletis zephyria]